VLLGESAYQVQQGFLADANALRRAAAASQAPPPAPGAAPAAKNAPGAKAAPGSPDEKKEGEQDMLAQFLLDHL
jgi:hypothetical protein